MAVAKDEGQVAQLAIVKSVRRVGRVAGKVLDAEDRAIIAQGMALVTGAGFILIAGAGIVGLAWRVFWLAVGG